MRPRCRRRQRGFTLDTSERMTQTQPRRPRDERGVSLIEVMVGMLMLTSALLALASAAGLALRTLVVLQQLCDATGRDGPGGHCRWLAANRVARLERVLG